MSELGDQSIVLCLLVAVSLTFTRFLFGDTLGMKDGRFVSGVRDVSCMQAGTPHTNRTRMWSNARQLLLLLAEGLSLCLRRLCVFFFFILTFAGSVLSKNGLDESDAFVVELREELISASIGIANVLGVECTSVKLSLPGLGFAEDTVLDLMIVGLLVQLAKSRTDDRVPVVESSLDESLAILLDRDELVVTVETVVTSDQVLSAKVHCCFVVELSDRIHLGGSLFVGVCHVFGEGRRREEGGIKIFFG